MLRTEPFQLSPLLFPEKWLFCYEKAARRLNGKALGADQIPAEFLWERDRTRHDGAVLWAENGHLCRTVVHTVFPLKKILLMILHWKGQQSPLDTFLHVVFHWNTTEFFSKLVLVHFVASEINSTDSLSMDFFHKIIFWKNYEIFFWNLRTFCFWNFY